MPGAGGPGAAYHGWSRARFDRTHIGRSERSRRPGVVRVGGYHGRGPLTLPAHTTPLSILRIIAPLRSFRVAIQLRALAAAQTVGFSIPRRAANSNRWS